LLLELVAGRARLGMAPVSLSRWVARRKLSTLSYSASAA
jgi:hypothetical protein